jgi:GNAT superfamily N-acetyltransferase
MQTNQTSNLILRDLGNGLVLRRSTPADADALADFNARVHSDDGWDKPDERAAAWTMDLLTRPHPTFDVGDFTLVEDTASGKIVSSLNLIPQTWEYAGVPFPVGRPELVGTHPDYRNRGLVRAQFEVVHQWCAERGLLVQAITGIPYYYRLFGYEMALNLGGGRNGYKVHVPKLKDGEEEPYQVRPAQEADLPFIAELYRQGCQRDLVCCVHDAAYWKYELNGKSEKDVNRFELHIIQSKAGEAVGFLAHPFFNWGPVLVATTYELKPGVSWGAVTPSVVRYLYAVGEAKAEAEGKLEEFGAFGFSLGVEHPIYQAFGDSLPRIRRPYAFYMRVPDLPAFIRQIAPALEKRLAASTFAGHNGELKIGFYRDGLLLGFEAGRLVKVEAQKPQPYGHSADAGFPELTFLQLLFGYRSLDELCHAFADCFYEDSLTHGLLNALFPKQASDVWPLS